MAQLFRAPVTLKEDGVQSSQPPVNPSPVYLPHLNDLTG